VNDITELLPLACGDVDILRDALSKVRAPSGRREEATQALMKRLGAGSIAGGELDVLRQLVEKEYTVRSLIIRQHAPGPDPYAGALALEVLETPESQALPSCGFRLIGVSGSHVDDRPWCDRHHMRNIAACQFPRHGMREIQRWWRSARRSGECGASGVYRKRSWPIEARSTAPI